MASPTVELIFGGGSFQDNTTYPNSDSVKDVLNTLQDAGIKTIDTAQLYQNSEKKLGDAHANLHFHIDTKYPAAFGKAEISKENLINVAQTSLDLLQMKQVNVYYLHTPVRNGALEDVLEGINELHRAGKFKYFGLSNFLAEEVEEVVQISKNKNYVAPSVYQGNYSVVARRVEKEVIPVLRKHNIAFHAYSPIAGGFLTKNVNQLSAGGEGRWDPNSTWGGVYHFLYNKPEMLKGLHLWNKISQESGIPKAELAYRWITYHSALKGEFGDGVVFGASNNSQLRETLAALKDGPLPPLVARRIGLVWRIVETAAPLDNYNDGLK